MRKTTTCRSRRTRATATRVVLLHAGVGDSRLWRAQSPALAARFEVVAPDLPGFGASPTPAGSFSFVDEAAALLPGALVGNSFGGRIALSTALARPDLVERLVLVAPGLADWDWSPELVSFWEREDALVEAGDVDAAVELNLETWVSPSHRAEVRPQQRRAFELQLAAGEVEVEWPATPPLSELEPQTLVVVGDRDAEDFRRIAEHVAAAAPRATLAVVEGAGHLVGLDRPDELNRLLLEFLLG